MITIRTGSYTQTEKDNLSDLFCFLSNYVCTFCNGTIFAEYELKCPSCPYKHIIRDMAYVDYPKKNDKSVT